MAYDLDKLRDEWPNGENEVLDNLLDIASRVLSGEGFSMDNAANSLSTDLLALDYYMRNGRIPTAWRN
jgi:hypothetical protein